MKNPNTSHMFTAGWMSGNGKGLLYIHDVKYSDGSMGWGVTYKPEEAKHFNNPESCIDFYLSVHAFPEEYIKFVRNGNFLIWDKKGNLIHPGLYLDKYLEDKNGN